MPSTLSELIIQRLLLLFFGYRSNMHHFVVLHSKKLTLSLTQSVSFCLQMSE